MEFGLSVQYALCSRYVVVFSVDIRHGNNSSGKDPLLSCYVVDIERPVMTNLRPERDSNLFIFKLLTQNQWSVLPS